MPFYETNKKVLAEFWASSNPDKKVFGTLEISDNGEIEISTTEPFEDKLSKIKREPIETNIIDSNNPTSNSIKSKTYYYRKNNFIIVYYENQENNKISKIKTKFNNDDEIPYFDWVEGECEFGYFKLFTSYNNLTKQKGFKYSTYSGFEFGILYKETVTKKQSGFDKVRFRIDYLSVFFNNKSKLSEVIAFPKGFDNPNETIYQIKSTEDKNEILSFWLDKYKITISSKIINYPTGDKKFERNQVKIKVTEDFWIDITKNTGFINEDEIFELQPFLERYFSFCLNTPVYTQSVTGFIDEKPIDVIFRKARGKEGKIENRKIIYTYDQFTPSSMNKFWKNKLQFATLYGYTLSNMQSQNQGLENFLFNYIQAVENYLNLKIKLPLFYKMKQQGKFPRLNEPKDNKPSFTEKFTEMVEQSNFLLNNCNFDLSIISHIKKIRNALAHGDAQEQNDLIRKTNISLLSIYFRKITKYCILKTLGFSENQILKFLTVYDK
jgi:ApeA N-terminal domain 1